MEATKIYRPVYLIALEKSSHDTDQKEEEEGEDLIGPSILKSLKVLVQVCKCSLLGDEILAMLGKISQNLEADAEPKKIFFQINKVNTCFTQTFKSTVLILFLFPNKPCNTLKAISTHICFKA